MASHMESRLCSRMPCPSSNASVVAPVSRSCVCANLHACELPLQRKEHADRVEESSVAAGACSGYKLSIDYADNAPYDAASITKWTA